MGGQGVKLSGTILSEAAGLGEGLWATHYGEYGSATRGGPSKVDIVMGPTTPTPAFKFGDVYGDTVLMQYADQFTVTGNHAGIPGLSMMGGLSKDRLPLGIQLLGRDYDEATLLRIGRVGLYFQSEDTNITGRWDNESRQWVMDNSARNEVRKGLRIANQLIAPELVLVPVSAPTEAQ